MPCAADPGLDAEPAAGDGGPDQRGEVGAAQPEGGAGEDRERDAVLRSRVPGEQHRQQHDHVGQGDGEDRLLPVHAEGDQAGGERSSEGCCGPCRPTGPRSCTSSSVRFGDGYGQQVLVGEADCRRGRPRGRARPGRTSRRTGLSADAVGTVSVMGRPIRGGGIGERPCGLRRPPRATGPRGGEEQAVGAMGRAELRSAVERRDHRRAVRVDRRLLRVVHVVDGELVDAQRRAARSASRCAPRRGR